MLTSLLIANEFGEGLSVGWCLSNEKYLTTWIMFCLEVMEIWRSSHPNVLLLKSVLKIRSKFTGEHPCQSVISIKLLCNFIEITLLHGCSPVNLLHIFRTPFLRNTFGWLLLDICSTWFVTCISPQFYDAFCGVNCESIQLYCICRADKA